MADKLPEYLDPVDTVLRDEDVEVSDILEDLSEQEEKEIERLEQKLADIRD